MTAPDYFDGQLFTALRAVFQQTNLEKTDFTTAYNFVFDPESNRMRKARFSVYGLPGLLEKYGLEIE